MAELSFPVRAGLRAAPVAGCTAALLTLVIHGCLGDGRLPLLLALGLGLEAAGLCFGLMWWLATQRLQRRPVIGAWRGAACALLVFVAVVATHACLNPGAAGRVYSVIGQLTAALLLFGWLALGLGGWIGRWLSAPPAEGAAV